MKLSVLVVGLLAGFGVSAAWLLSEPEVASDSLSPGDRLAMLKGRLNAAVADGQAAGIETQNRLRHELDAYRAHPDRPGVS